MNNALQVFDYNGSAVRTVNKDGEIWFVAKDVCDVLELTNPTVAIEELDDDEKGSLRITEGTSPKGGNPNMNIISESGLYALIFKSRKPEAKKFRKWVTSTVLPQIKRTGSFSIKPDKLTRSIMSAAKMIFSAAGIKNNQLALALDKIVVHYTGESMLGISGIDIDENQVLTSSDIGSIIGISARTIKNLLTQEGYQPNFDWELILDDILNEVDLFEAHKRIQQ